MALDITSNVDAALAAVKEDLSRTARQFIPEAHKTAEYRSAATAFSRWLRNAAKAARVPRKVLAKHGSHNRKVGNSRVLQVGTLPVRGTRLRPRELKRGGVSFYGGRHLPKAFIPKIKRKPVFQREGKSRLPVEVPTFPIKQEVVTVGRDVVPKTIAERYPIEFKRRINVELRKLARRRRAQSNAAIRRFGAIASGLR
jgi:hypothetical protein